MKTWDETIAHIQNEESYSDLVRDAYMDPDNSLNIDRFYKSEEYATTKEMIENYIPSYSGRLLDLGAGNGISSVAFAKDGFEVVALEPDRSDMIGSGAIQKSKELNGLTNLSVVSSYAEDANLQDESFDIVYARQSMHHANDLEKFISEAYRVLKPNGLLITVRDHVINPGDLNAFLAAHDLHKYYGGENAYTLDEYKGAFKKAGFLIQKCLKPYDTPINYAPSTTEQLKARLKKSSRGIPSSFLFGLYLNALNYKSRNVPGRLFTFICKKRK